MPITLTDEQLKAIQSGKATIEDFTQPQGDVRIRSIKDDCILIKNVLARVGDAQLTINLKMIQNHSNIMRLLKFIAVVAMAQVFILGAVIIFFYASGVI